MENRRVRGVGPGSGHLAGGGVPGIGARRSERWQPNGVLIPESVARDVIAAAADESAVLALGNVVVMPSGVTNVPVVSVAPSAVFVGVGARKPTSTIEWTAETLSPEEIALTLYIPDAYLDDAGFPVWESVRTEVAKAIGKTWGGFAPTGRKNSP